MLETGTPAINNKYTVWYQSVTHVNGEAIALIQNMIDRQKPEVLFFEYARLALLASLLKIGSTPVIFRAHNFELMHDYEKDSLNRELKSENFMGMIKSNYRKWLSIYHNEKLMFRIASCVLSISHEDCLSFIKLYRVKNVSYLPPYIPDIPLTYKVKQKPVLDVVYMGSNLMNNVNYSGALYLVEKVIPYINKALPDKFKFHIIGHDSDRFNKYTENIPNLKIHGYVSDIYGFLNGMDIACLPVNAGRGCKVKMFESLAMGLPTIGFSKTFTGIPYTENCFETAENPREFVTAFEKMLSTEHRENLSLHSRQMIKKISNEDKLLNDLEHQLL